MDWTEDVPTEPGLYLFQSRSEAFVRIKQVSQGKWQNAQNPDWLYAYETQVNELRGYWYGPVPETPNGLS